MSSNLLIGTVTIGALAVGTAYTCTKSFKYKNISSLIEKLSKRKNEASLLTEDPRTVNAGFQKHMEETEEAKRQFLVRELNADSEKMLSEMEAADVDGLFINGPLDSIKVGDMIPTLRNSVKGMVRATVLEVNGPYLKVQYDDGKTNFICAPSVKVEKNMIWTLRGSSTTKVPAKVVEDDGTYLKVQFADGKTDFICKASVETGMATIEKTEAKSATAKLYKVKGSDQPKWTPEGFKPKPTTIVGKGNKPENLVQTKLQMVGEDLAYKVEGKAEVKLAPVVVAAEKKIEKEAGQPTIVEAFKKVNEAKVEVEEDFPCTPVKKGNASKFEVQTAEKKPIDTNTIEAVTKKVMDGPADQEAIQTVDAA